MRGGLGDTAQCAPGEDACPLGSCEGAWSICNANCTKTYDVTAEATGDGADCPADDGEEADCSPGEGSPLFRHRLRWRFTGCDASCLTQTYSVAVEASGSGGACPSRPAGLARALSPPASSHPNRPKQGCLLFGAFDKCSNETHLAALGQSRAECMAEELGWTTAQVIGAIVGFFAVVILLLLIVCFLLCKLEHHFCHPEHWLWDHSCGRCIHQLGGSVRFHPSEGWVGEQEKEDKDGAVDGKISGDVEGNGKDVAPPEKEEQEDEADEKKTEQQATSKAEPAASAAEVSRAPVHLLVERAEQRACLQARQARLEEMARSLSVRWRKTHVPRACAFVADGGMHPSFCAINRSSQPRCQCRAAPQSDPPSTAAAETAAAAPSEAPPAEARHLLQHLAEHGRAAALGV